MTIKFLPVEFSPAVAMLITTIDSMFKSKGGCRFRPTSITVKTDSIIYHMENEDVIVEDLLPAIFSVFGSLVNRHGDEADRLIATEFYGSSFMLGKIDQWKEYDFHASIDLHAQKEHDVIFKIDNRFHDYRKTVDGVVDRRIESIDLAIDEMFSKIIFDQDVMAKNAQELVMVAFTMDGYYCKYLNDQKDQPFRKQAALIPYEESVGKAIVDAILLTGFRTVRYQLGMVLQSIIADPNSVPNQVMKKCNFSPVFRVTSHAKSLDVAGDLVRMTNLRMCKPTYIVRYTHDGEILVQDSTTNPASALRSIANMI